MLPDLIHISRSDVLALDISAAEMRSAVREVFEDLATGQCRFQPKSQLEMGVGHVFQTMAAASYRWSVAMMKWVTVVPAAPDAALPAISAVICLNDLATGHPLAMMDGEIITLQRTAAISALSAEYLSPPEAKVLALVGCGAQARSHLEAFTDLCPTIGRVICYSRSRRSAEALAAIARDRGLEADVVDDPAELVPVADVIVSMIPASSELRPFLDATKMKPEALAVMVDLGRSWLPDSLSAFDLIGTDSLEQMQHPVDATGKAVTSAQIGFDLLTGPSKVSGRKAFCFRGNSAADLAAARLVHDLARARGLGTRLSR